MPNAVALSPSTLKDLDSTQRLTLASAPDEEICSLHRRRRQDLSRITSRLADLHASRGYLALGFASVGAYAKKRLGWGRPRSTPCSSCGRAWASSR